jgi:Tfp pilus assembly protein FimV
MGMTDQDAPPAPAADGVTSEVAVKTGELLLDYLHTDVERVTAETRVAEERARGNATVAAAALPLLTFLRSFNPKPTPLEIGLTNTLLALIVIVLGLLLGVMWQRKTSRTQAPWYKQRQEDVYRETPNAAYDRFLHEMHSMWIGYFEDGLKVRHSKYKWLHLQNIALLALLVTFCGLLFVTFR